MATLTGILKVDASTMQGYVSTFSSCASQVQSKTQQMMTTVNSLATTWKGTASDTYRRKFNQLDDDMKRMFKMIQEHSTDLNQMIRNYNDAETGVTGKFSGLAEDVIV